MYCKALCLMVTLMLGACSNIETFDAETGRELSKEKKIVLKNWRLQGRLLIKGDDLLTANIQWQHRQEADRIKLAGTLGLGAILIELSENEIVLDTGKGERQRSQDIDAFVARQIGFVVPITALRSWVVGSALQNVPVVELEHGFQQLGWRISYNEYMRTTAGIMPRKIKISKDNIKLKLIIDQWGIE